MQEVDGSTKFKFPLLLKGWAGVLNFTQLPKADFPDRVVDSTFSINIIL